MDPFLFCPVKGCENEPEKVLDLRVYLGNSPWPQALVCNQHYGDIIRKPKHWKFSSAWDTGLVIEEKK